MFKNNSQKVIITGLIEKIKFSYKKILLLINNNEKILITITKEQFQKLKIFLGKEIVVIGTAYFNSNGELLYIKMENFIESNEKFKNMFSKKPYNKRNMQEILFNNKEKINSIYNIIGKWPGDETDEEFEEILRSL